MTNTPRKGVPVPVCIDVPTAFEAQARYAARMLLLPYHAAPAWTERDDLAGPGLYYGTDPEGLPEDIWSIGIEQATLDWFLAGSDPLPEDIRYVRIDGDRVPVLFPATGDLSFDPFASTFFFLSGWQEWKTRYRDEHGRFMMEESLQSRCATLKQPSVEYYRLVVGSALLRKGMSLETRSWGDRDWMFCPTHDIDYLKKWRKGILYREIIQRGLLGREGMKVRTRVSRVTHAAKALFEPGDPFRLALVRMRKETAFRGGRGTYFFKAGHRGPHDVPYSLDDDFAREQLSLLRESGFEIGLHPSYHGFDHPDQLDMEQTRLQLHAGVDVTSIRSHYLRFDHPRTARLYSASGFAIDSTLGFAGHEGFRHGTCLPFPLFDPERGEELDLWEMPLTCMESTLFNRRHLDPGVAFSVTKHLMETCRRFGGVFVGLWHNTLWDEQDFPGWGGHFIRSLDLAVDESAGIESLSEALRQWRQS